MYCKESMNEESLLVICWLFKPGCAQIPWLPMATGTRIFGSFVLCGSGKLPKTVLEKGMKPFGDPIE
jgi:hypothetical protein